ncbi:LLM class flavin-dependent oxidoreductase [Cellulomonas xiejunii]|uniref:LLM class flavin-dependent oxidoreductase n=1 Tax=Cellulomonas xiejunii TaxID=2968083 RepID=UPI001D0E6122|nr:LLM class flavin-dependent oxidoreductase [Cellulomonas xiejunii]MCC2315917.1 LLM class flavin-dependent oxidoreductase [Cellulomonas xiejunii]
MTTRPRREGQLHLNAFLMSTGHHEASWRLPESDPSYQSTNIAYLQRLAQTAERGHLDSIFFADGPALFRDVGRRPSGTLEPTVVLAAIAAVTSRIGLIATASTTYNDPYNLARRFASVDHISGGRAGWNIVTTAHLEAARNFGYEDLPSHHARYQRAAEFIDVALKLWDSWEDDVEIGDKVDGVWGDSERIHPPEHVGEHFRVAGALTTPRSPQAYPLLVQAGSSEDGKDLAARYAEAVFTAQQTLDDALAFSYDLKRRAVEWGRDPAGLLVLPGIVPVIGATQAEARAKEDELDRLIRPEFARVQLAKTLRVDPDDLPLDRELPADLPSEDEIEGAKSRYTLIVELARRERLTVRQLIGRLGGGRGHRTFSGTAEQVADAIQEWWDAGAADGFNIMPAVLPSGLEDFVDQVVPVLVDRGLFRSEYTGTTLREHYGLARPEHPRHRDGSGLGVGVVARPATSDPTTPVPTTTSTTHEGAQA